MPQRGKLSPQRPPLPPRYDKGSSAYMPGTPLKKVDLLLFDPPVSASPPHPRCGQPAPARGSLCLFRALSRHVEQE